MSEEQAEKSDLFPSKGDESWPRTLDAELLKCENKSLRQELASIKLARKELETRLAESSEALKRSREQESKLATEYQSWTHKVLSLRKRLDELEQGEKSLEKAVRVVLEENQKLSQAAEASSRSLQVLEAKMARLNEDWEAKTAKLASELAEKEAKSSDAQSRSLTLKSQVDELSRLIKRSEEDNSVLREQKNNLQELLDKTNHTLRINTEFTLEQKKLSESLQETLTYTTEQKKQVEDERNRCLIEFNNLKLSTSVVIDDLSTQLRNVQEELEYESKERLKVIRELEQANDHRYIAELKNQELSRELAAIREKKCYDNSTQTFDLVSHLSKIVQTDHGSMSQQRHAFAQTSRPGQKDGSAQTARTNARDAFVQYDRSVQFRSSGTQTVTAETGRTSWTNDDLPDLAVTGSATASVKAKTKDLPLTQDLIEELMDDEEAENDFVRAKKKPTPVKETARSVKSQLMRPIDKAMDDTYFLNKNLLYATPEADFQKLFKSQKPSSTSLNMKLLVKPPRQSTIKISKIGAEEPDSNQKKRVRFMPSQSSSPEL